VTLIELPRRRAAPRTFVEPPAGLQRRVARALAALGDLPDDLDLPGLDALADALIHLADDLDGDSDLEPDADDEIVSVDDLPLFAGAVARRPP
jgi:hypothetical protein